jgi:hypothetical protein
MLTVILVKSNAFIMNFLTFGAKNLVERISPAVGVMLTIRCSIYSAFVALYRAHHPVSAMLTVFLVKIRCIHHEFFNFRGQKSNRTYLSCCWGYVDYSMFVILRIYCFIQRTSSGLDYVNRVPCQIQCIHHEFFNFRGQKSNRTYLPCYWVM